MQTDMVHVRLGLDEIKELRDSAGKCDHSAPALAAIIIRAGLAAIQSHPGPFLPLQLKVSPPVPARDTERILKMNEPASYKRK